MFSVSLSSLSSPRFPSQKLLRPLPPRRTPASAAASVVSSLQLGVEDIAELAHNKVLVVASVSAAIGHLSKPLTSAISGKGFDLRAAIRSGGMPSTHSAVVAAAATCLGLERGFSDSIFGMSVVFAALFMYDAQGVRREVGLHAKIVNEIQSSNAESPLRWEDDEQNIKLKNCAVNGEKLASVHEKVASHGSNSESYSFPTPAITSTKAGVSRPKIYAKESLPNEYSNYRPLKESVGHTEIEVVVGAFLGFIVSITTEFML